MPNVQSPVQCFNYAQAWFLHVMDPSRTWTDSFSRLDICRYPSSEGLMAPTSILIGRSKLLSPILRPRHRKAKVVCAEQVQIAATIVL